MPYARWTPGEDSRYLWHSMSVPEWKGTCKKFQEGRLLMQRYQFAVHWLEWNDAYDFMAKHIRERSVILASRMVEHAKNCAVCQNENRLAEENFYGVFK